MKLMLSVSFNATHAEDNDKVDHFPWPKVMDGMYEDIGNSGSKTK